MDKLTDNRVKLLIKSLADFSTQEQLFTQANYDGEKLIGVDKGVINRLSEDHFPLCMSEVILTLIYHPKNNNS